MERLRIYFGLIITALISACSSTVDNQKQLLVEGAWHVELALTAKTQLPFDLHVNKKDSSFVFEISNADEKIKVTDITITGKEITFKDPVFNSWFEGSIESPSKIKGFWFKEDKKYKIPFVAEHGIKDRFPAPKKLSKATVNITGKWEVDFSHGTEDHYKAIGVFEQVDNYVTGTFITETGDYRYLEGNMYNNNLYLSTFDGSHAFLFKATLLDGNKLKGNFWSGSHWEEPWIASKNNAFSLRDADSLTYLKDGYDKLAFSFPNEQGDTISLDDKRFEDKVVIVNIMGPWCPNCKDETAYLSDLYKSKNLDGLEVIALSFNKTDEFEKSKAAIEKIKEHYGVEYEMLIAGKANKIEAAKALPMLNHIMSYPTSIFIDREGNIRKIRTGFYGPGTGEYYDHYIEQTNSFIKMLLEEDVVSAN